jgi:hypothetical protein
LLRFVDDFGRCGESSSWISLEVDFRGVCVSGGWVGAVSDVIESGVALTDVGCGTETELEMVGVELGVGAVACFGRF